MSYENIVISSHNLTILSAMLLIMGLPLIFISEKFIPLYILIGIIGALSYVSSKIFLSYFMKENPIEAKKFLKHLKKTR